MKANKNNIYLFYIQDKAYCINTKPIQNYICIFE